MADVFTKQARSRIMGMIRTTDTHPEIIVQQLLEAAHYRYAKCCKHLPGKPDIVLRSAKKAIFVHGCFWHGHKACSRSGRPAANAAFWNKKLDTNIKRDRKVRRELKRLGWDVITIWQCALRRPLRIFR